MTVTLLCVCILIMNVLTDPVNKRLERKIPNLRGKNVNLGNGKSFGLSSLKGGNYKFKQIHMGNKVSKVLHGKRILMGGSKVLNGKRILMGNKVSKVLHGKRRLEIPFPISQGGSGEFKQILIGGSKVANGKGMLEHPFPISQTLNIGGLQTNSNWYKNIMNGKNGTIDIRNLIKGNIVEAKHSEIIPFILNEEGFRQFKKKNPNHKYIYAQTMKIMNDQEMQHLQSIKSKFH